MIELRIEALEVIVARLVLKLMNMEHLPTDEELMTWACKVYSKPFNKGAKKNDLP